MRTHYNYFAGGDVGRIEAPSDGIFTFAATVLVLDFRTRRRQRRTPSAEPTGRPRFSGP
jgi:uncharacterized membrane protein